MRPVWFAQNFSEGYLLEPAVSGQLRLLAGDSAATFTNAEDRSPCWVLSGVSCLGGERVLLA